MEDVIKKKIEELVEGYPSDLVSLSNEEHEAFYNKIITGVIPIIDALSKEERQDVFIRLFYFNVDESIKAEKLNVNPSAFLHALDSVVYYMKDEYDVTLC